MLFYMRGSFELTRLTDSENLTILLFSMLYTINIAISNVSLYVSVLRCAIGTSPAQYMPQYMPQ